MAKSPKKRRRSLAEIVAAEHRAHVRDCVTYRRRTARVLERMERRQDALHLENKADRTKEFAALHGDIASIKQADANATTRKAWWWNRARDAAISALFVACVYMAWHIVATKGLTP